MSKTDVSAARAVAEVGRLNPTCGARLDADRVGRVPQMLKSPDDLVKVSQTKIRLQREKASVEAKLKEGAKEQVRPPLPASRVVPLINGGSFNSSTPRGMRWRSSRRRGRRSS